MLVFIVTRTGLWFFFFFQAEDGIRDGRVTGVQTCALPIFDGLVPLTADEGVGVDRCGQQQRTGDRKHQDPGEAHDGVLAGHDAAVGAEVVTQPSNAVGCLGVAGAEPDKQDQPADIGAGEVLVPRCRAAEHYREYVGERQKEHSLSSERPERPAADPEEGSARWTVSTMRRRDSHLVTSLPVVMLVRLGCTPGKSQLGHPPRSKLSTDF